VTRPAIRRIRPDDYDVVGALLVAAYDAVGPFDERYRRFLGDPAGWVDGAAAVWVTTDEADRPTGVVAFVLPGDREFEGARPYAGDAGFRFLAVAPGAQGTGAGAALLDRCIEEASERGCRRLAIHSMTFMTAAHALYLTRGFDRRPDLDVTFPSGVGIAFTKDLTEDAAAHFPPPGPVPVEPPWFEDVWNEESDANPC
jgi:GNAT superfamily N-acetyltransferase